MTWFFNSINYYHPAQNKNAHNMKKLPLLLLSTSLMVVSNVVSAQKTVSLISIDNGTKHSISSNRLVMIMENCDTLITGEFADRVMEIYDASFPCYDPNEPAILILKSTITNDVIFIQEKEDGKIHSFRILSKELGWLKAGRKARKKIEKLIPKQD